jgi:hypothetical protein
VRIALIVATLLAVPCIQLIPETESDGASGEMNNPVMLLGSGTGVDGTIHFTSSSIQIPTYFDLNTENFYNPSVSVDIKAHQYSGPNDHGADGNWNEFPGWESILRAEYVWVDGERAIGASNPVSGQVINEATATAISIGGSLSIKEVDPYEGFYVVAFSAADPPIHTSGSHNGSYLIEIEVTVREGSIASSEQKYYFGANLRYQSQGGTPIDTDPGMIQDKLAINICLYDTNGQKLIPKMRLRPPVTRT